MTILQEQVNNIHMKLERVDLLHLYVVVIIIYLDFIIQLYKLQMEITL